MMMVWGKIQPCSIQVLWAAFLLAAPALVRADQEVLTDGVAGDGHMEIRGDQYGAFGSFSVMDPGFGNYNPDGPVGLRPWSYWSAIMLTDGEQWQWLMDAEDWPGDFGARLPDDVVVADQITASARTSSFQVPLYGDLQVDLLQELSPYNIVQTYTFKNPGNSPLELKALWMTDVDMEFAQDALSNLAGFVLDDDPRVYFIEDSDVPGMGDPGVADRDRRISVIAQAGDNVTFEGALAERTPVGTGGATHLHFYAQTMNGIEEDYLNSVQEIVREAGTPVLDIDENDDNLMDEPGDVGGAMQFALAIPAQGTATLTLDFVGGKLSNAAISGTTIPGDFNRNQTLDAGDLDLQAVAMTTGPAGPEYDLNNDGQVNFTDRQVWVNDLKNTWIGDSNLDDEFNSGDLVQVFAGGKYETGQPAGWGEGDWNGDTVFSSGDLVAAFTNGGYEKGPQPAGQAVPEPGSAILALCGVLSLLDRLRRR
jgi:hypothetical protein